ncbi:MAG: UvrD-helicase domain-containing protein [Firmicutes bacterium]|nr:UvrD-helicase domain-containing protein [Bacillota bacterium]
MQKIEFNKQQLDAINIRNKDILLSASAGSGKTTVMINRVVSLLKEGYDLSSMLIVTFTKAAAADMREKLSKALIKHKDLKHQLINLTDADISTIHVWCKKLIDQYFYLINIDPDYKLIEDSINLLKKAAAKAFIEYKKENINNEAFFELEEIFSDNLGAEDLIKIVVKLVLECNISGIDGIQKLCDNECRKTLLEQINIKKTIFKQEIDALYQDALMVNFVRNIIPIKELTVALELTTLDIAAAKGMVGKDPAFIAINDKYKELKDRVLDLVQKEIEIKNAKAQNDKYLNILLALKDKTNKEFLALKRKKNALDFNDLEHYAFKILCSEAMKQIQNKYKFIFVDEYQDINPLQNKIIQFLKTKQNHLFLIGDIKQSIYAFRGCEPSIFADLYQEYKHKDDAAVIELNTNYRSKNEILQFSNKLFSRIMTDDFGGVNYKSNGAFDIGDKENSGAKVGIHVLSEDNQIKAAALKIANVLSLEKGIKPKDIAILLRSDIKRALSLAQELNNIGIKAALPQKDIFVGFLIEYLKLISNRFDDEVLINTLLGPFGGFDEIELAKIRMQYNEEKFFFEAMDKCQDEKVQQFFSNLKKYRQLSKKENAVHIINQIVSDTNYFQIIFSFGLAAAKSFDAFLLSLNDNRHLSIDELLEEGIAENEVEADDDAVKVMTVHKSKGLEFEYVFILDANKRFNLQELNNKVLINKGSLAAKAYNFEYGEEINSTAYLLVKDLLKKRQIEEELRLLYVAITRAKRGLDIFIKSEKDADDKKIKTHDRAISWWDWLVNLYDEYASNEFVDINFNENETKDKQIILPKADEKLIESLKKEIMKQHTIDTTTPKMYVTAAAKLIKEEDEEESKNYKVMFLDDGGIDKSSAKLGTLYHTAMENIRFEEDFESEWGALNDEIKENVDKAKIKKAIDSMRDLIGGAKYFKEQSFIYKVCASEFGGHKGNFTLMQGVLDLIILKNDGAIIVDYKTGKGTNPEYVRQLEWYKRAASEVLKLKNIEGILYLFDTNKLINH